MDNNIKRNANNRNSFAEESLPEALSGLIERVVFFNEETGFAILKVKVKGYRDLVTVKCSVPAANAGEWLTAQGRWIKDKDYGLQFDAELVSTSSPSTIEGIEKYLASGLIKGIGPVYAKKLVQRFGKKIFDIIENQSAKLEEVDGIGPKRRRIIKEAWMAQKAVRQIMVFLHSHGVGTSRAVKIYKTYGEKAIDIIRENPYRLSLDIPGIGFKSADRIAQKLGIPQDSIIRAIAGLNHILLEATNDGHCALPEKLVKSQAIELLDVKESIVETAIAKALLDKQLIKETINQESFIYLPALRNAEEKVAEKIMLLSRGAPPYPAINFEKAIEWYQNSTGKILAPSQCDAIKSALNNKVMIITGGPGVGKTTIVHALITILKAKKVKCLLCAPTGRAAKRLSEVTGFDARTIHRLLEVNPQTGGFLRNEHNALECDLLVVDETSMVDILLMSHLLKAVPLNSALLLVGDVDQLPSVGPGVLLRDLIQSGLIPVARLTEVFRQVANSLIITGSHQINKGLMPKFATKDELSDFYFVERNTPEDITDTLIELVKNRIPNKFGFHPVRDIQVLTPMNRGSLGINELNARFQEALNPLDSDEPAIEKFGWQYRLRDKVMQIENNYNKDVFNGDIGEIKHIDLVEQELVVKYDQREVVYEFDELDEIIPAYAITIHKSQGSEFPAVVIPVAMQQYVMLQRNLIYTAVTRGKKLVVIIGQRKALAYAIKNNRLVDRYSGLIPRLQALKSKYFSNPVE